MSLPAFLKGRLSLPLIGSPMFIVSQPSLVIAQCRAGIVGAFPSLNARPSGVFEQWLQQLGEALTEQDAPFAVNLIVHKTNSRLEEDLALCVKYRVPIVITSLGAREHVNEAVHSYGGIVLHDVINNVFARKAIEKGADGLIAVAAGAGGHAGTLSPFALVEEIRAWFDGPLALSGAIATGRSIAAARMMGADFGYMGSPFIATEEANAEPAYKQMIVDSGAGDIVYSDYFTGVLGNYLRPSIAAAGLDADKLPKAADMDFASIAGGDKKAWRDVWGAGQGIGVIDKIQPAADFIAQLKAEYQAAVTAFGA
ncbi:MULTISPECIES: NAD(P)H-dependent flavin oxidoreductase [Sphingobium]|uniref:NAD(P)H-dependent flavin oxidoreductase n=1 Tax=Sphingobium TaxID=165695 RepID=UPI00159BF746|nr:nitronate monooxygenase family protein [Sphingobium sp. 15-1]